MSNDRQELLEMSFGKVFTKLALPAMIGMMSVGLYNLADAIFVGQLVSPEGVGAIVVAFNLVSLNIALAMLFATGVMSVLSRAIGEKDGKVINKLFGNVVVGVSFLSLLLTIIVYNWAGPLLRFVGAEGEILALGTEYLKTISLGFVFSGLGPALNFLIRGEGQMKSAMKIIISGVLINLVLNPILIKGFNMGIQGAALATIFAQCIVLIGNIIYFKSGNSIIKITKESFKMSFDIMPKILSVGFSGMIMQIMPAIQMALMFRVLFSYGGENSVIVMSAAYRVMTFAFIVLWGVAQGIQPIIGANYGARQFARVKKAFLLFTGIATAIAGSLWLSFMIFPKFIMGWFITDANLVQRSAGQFKIFLGIFFINGILAMSIVFFQAIGKGSKAAILVTGRQILFFIPLVLFLPKLFGETGAWLAMPLGDLLITILGILLVILEFKTIDKIKVRYSGKAVLP